MRTKFLALSLGLLSISLTAQKNELKTAEKAIKKQNFTAAVSALKSAEALIANADNKLKTKFYFLQGQAYKGTKNMKAAAEAFSTLFALEKEIKKSTYTTKAAPIVSEMANTAAQEGNNLYSKDKNYKAAAEKYETVYLLSPTDTAFLYNAAISYNLAKEYDTSLSLFNKLLEEGYTGITTTYKATNKETKQVEQFADKMTRDLMIKSKSHINPLDDVSKSKKGDILKSIAGVLVSQGKTDEAIEALHVARKADPNDVNLILVEADLYIKLEKMDKFGELMELAVKQKPNDPTLYYNLGVVNAQQKNTEKAKEYYNKAIELRPEYGDAYMNLAVLVLEKEKAIVDEMNKNLSDFDKYDKLAEQQKDVYREAIPLLEKADQYNRSADTVRTLLNLYETLGMDDKAATYRELYKNMK